MNEATFSSSPRHIFVSMLFALAVGKLAQSGNEILSAGFIVESVLQWLLALFVVLASWVDWTNSFTNEVQVKIKIVSKEFIILLLDVFILFSYFHLITSISISSVNETVAKNSQVVSIVAIFVLYVAWDYLFYVHSGTMDKINGLLPPVVALLLSLLVAYQIEKWSGIVITASLFGIVILFRVMHASRSKKIS